VNRSRGISTVATSVAIGFIAVIFIIGGFFIFKYLSHDPVDRAVIQTLKLEHSISQDTHTVTILESDDTYFKGIVTSKDGGTSQTVVGKLENNTATFLYFGSGRPTCELIVIHKVPKDILGNCKIFNGSALTVNDAKDKIEDNVDESFSIIGFLSLSDDPSNGGTTITSGGDIIDLDNVDVGGAVNNEVVVVDVTEVNGEVVVDSVNSLNEDDEETSDIVDNTSNNTIEEPYTESLSEYYNIYDLNEAELLKLLND